MPATREIEIPPGRWSRPVWLGAKRYAGRLVPILLVGAALIWGVDAKAAELMTSRGTDESHPIVTAADTAGGSATQLAGVMPAPASPHGRLPVVIISDLTDYADDSIAILMLLRSGKVDIRGIITTSGNVCAHRGATEASRLLESAGAATIPVVEGFPLAWHEERRRFYTDVERPSWPASAYVGAFGDSSTCGDEPATAGSATRAVDFLIEQARTAEGGLTIVLIGPATILAEALRRDPEFSRRIRQVQAMGGAIKVAGNVSPHAEFNVWFDPEAMASVLASRIPVTLVPLDATRSVAYDPLPQANPPGAGFPALHLAAYLKRAGLKHNPVRMWDEVLAAIVIDPTLIERSEDAYLAVATQRDHHYGAVVSVPAAPDGSSRPVKVVTSVRAQGVRRLIARLLLGEG